MLARGRAVLLFLAFVLGLRFCLSAVTAQAERVTDESWRLHPALAEPDGESHRGDKMVAAEVKDPRVLKELSRRFCAAKPLRLVEKDGRVTVCGAEDFERRQEYLLRLLDHYWFSKRRLVGMTRAEVEQVFGPLGADPERPEIAGGRDIFCIWFKDGRVSGAFYSMGY
jgi:hypothetical protein